MTMAEDRRLNVFFQPFDGRKVEMVGRLVEEQDVRLGRHDAGQGVARRSPPESIAGPLLASQAEMTLIVARRDARQGPSAAST